jgi:hypothetical protein
MVPKLPAKTLTSTPVLTLNYQFLIARACSDVKARNVLSKKISLLKRPLIKNIV